MPRCAIIQSVIQREVVAFLKNVNIFRRFIIFLSFCAVAFEVINYSTAKASFRATKKIPEFAGSPESTTLLILITLFALAFFSLILPKSLSGLSLAFTALPFRYSFFALAEGNIPKYNPALSLLLGAILLAGALVNFFGYACDRDLRPSWKIPRCVISSFLICAVAALLKLITLKINISEEQLPLCFSAYNVLVISAMVPAVTAMVLSLYGRGKDKYLGIRQLIVSVISAILPAALLAFNIASA